MLPYCFDFRSTQFVQIIGNEQRTDFERVGAILQDGVVDCVSPSVT